MICCGRKHGLGLCVKDLKSFKFIPALCEPSALGWHGLKRQGRCLIGSDFPFCGVQAWEYRIPIPWHPLSLHQQWQAVSTFHFLAPLCAPWVHNCLPLLRINVIPLIFPKGEGCNLWLKPRCSGCENIHCLVVSMSIREGISTQTRGKEAPYLSLRSSLWVSLNEKETGPVEPGWGEAKSP